MKITEDQILPGSQQSFNDLKMLIPATCPTLLDTCPNIKNEYALKILLDASGLNFSKYLKISIDIGTIPIVPESELVSVLENVVFDKKALEFKSMDGRETLIDTESIILEPFMPLYPIFFPNFK